MGLLKLMQFKVAVPKPKRNKTSDGIKRTTNKIVKGKVFQDEDGTFKVSKGYSNRLCRIIDREGRIILKTIQRDIISPKEIVWMHDFSEGYAIVDNIDGSPTDFIVGWIDCCIVKLFTFKIDG